jgi:hypothetical protein
MSVKLHAAQIVDRPLATVFDFCARQHVRNHPRWDPDIQLEQVSPGPIGVGTIIRRRNSRSGTPVPGTMEVVEFQPDASIAMTIREGPREMRGGMTFEGVGDIRTTITSHAEIPWIDESMDTTFLVSRMQRSVDNIKRLVESET